MSALDISVCQTECSRKVGRWQHVCCRMLYMCLSRPVPFPRTRHPRRCLVYFVNCIMSATNIPLVAYGSMLLVQVSVLSSFFFDALSFLRTAAQQDPMGPVHPRGFGGAAGPLRLGRRRQRHRRQRRDFVVSRCRRRRRHREDPADDPQGRRAQGQRGGVHMGRLAVEV